jgi:hypothetical protein
MGKKNIILHKFSKKINDIIRSGQKSIIMCVPLFYLFGSNKMIEINVINGKDEKKETNKNK